MHLCSMTLYTLRVLYLILTDFAPVTLEVIASCGTKRMETSNTSHKQERTNKYYQKKNVCVSCNKGNRNIERHFQ